MADIAPATPADEEAIVALLDGVDRFYGAADVDPADLTAANVRSALFDGAPSAYVLLARVDGEPVGFAAYSYLWPAAGSTRSAFLKELYVVEAHRSAGVGRELMAALCEVAEKTGCTRVEWQTDEYNAGSRRFYANLGVPEHAGKVFYRIEAADIARIAHQAS
jgi:GNAT superfamily N-acetyltransferase